jgi:hypothetical protein
MQSELRCEEEPEWIVLHTLTCLLPSLGFPWRCMQKVTSKKAAIHTVPSWASPRPAPHGASVDRVAPAGSDGAGPSSAMPAPASTPAAGAASCAKAQVSERVNTRFPI